MINYEAALLIAILSVTYTYLLTQGGQIFNWFYNKMDKLFKTDDRQMKGKGKHFLFKILIDCHLCFSGQLAFWLFSITNYNLYLSINNFQIALSVIFTHIFFVAFTILSSAIIKGIYTKYIE